MHTQSTAGVKWLQLSLTHLFAETSSMPIAFSTWLGL